MVFKLFNDELSTAHLFLSEDPLWGDPRGGMMNFSNCDSNPFQHFQNPRRTKLFENSNATAKRLKANSNVDKMNSR